MPRPANNGSSAQLLRDHGLRVTPHRLAILELLGSSAVPLSLMQIREQLESRGCAFATVFRFLADLEKKHLVEKVAWVDGSTRHEVRFPKAHAHHHYLICRNCQKAEEIKECVVEELENKIARSRGYTSVTHSLQLSGICPACQGTKKPSRKPSGLNLTP